MRKRKLLAELDRAKDALAIASELGEPMGSLRSTLYTGLAHARLTSIIRDLERDIGKRADHDI